MDLRIIFFGGFYGKSQFFGNGKNGCVDAKI